MSSRLVYAADVIATRFAFNKLKWTSRKTR